MRPSPGLKTARVSVACRFFPPIFPRSENRWSERADFPRRFSYLSDRYGFFLSLRRYFPSTNQIDHHSVFPGNGQINRVLDGTILR